MSEPSAEASAQVELFSEGWSFAALLDMVVEHCGAGQEGVVRSFGWRANARAMRVLAEAGYIRITSQHDDDIEALVDPSGRTLMTVAVARLDQAVPGELFTRARRALDYTLALRPFTGFWVSRAQNFVELMSRL